MKAINLAKNSAFGLMSKTSGIYASNTVLGQYNGSNDLREAAKTYLIAKERVRDAENQRALWISKGKDKYERELRRYYAEEADTWVTADIEKILKRDKLLMQSELKYNFVKVGNSNRTRRPLILTSTRPE